MLLLLGGSAAELGWPPAPLGFIQVDDAHARGSRVPDCVKPPRRPRGRICVPLRAGTDGYQDRGGPGDGRVTAGVSAILPAAEIAGDQEGRLIGTAAAAMVEDSHDGLGAVEALQFLSELRRQYRCQDLAVEDHPDILDHRRRPVHRDAALFSFMPDSPIGCQCLVSRRRTVRAVHITRRNPWLQGY
jgi:hypothetical protein